MSSRQEMPNEKYGGICWKGLSAKMGMSGLILLKESELCVLNGHWVYKH